MIINNTHFNCELQEVLDELVSELRANGSQLLQKQKNGAEYVQVTCPYHNNGMEKRPSAGIRKSDGLFHCFACGEVHSLPELISYCFGYSDDVVGVHGFRWLLKNFATVQVEERKPVSLDLSRSGLTHALKIVPESELDKYRWYHPYMYKRGLTDPVIELFDIGYDKETDCITFPVRDIEGRCLFVARRSVSIKWFNYPQGVEKPLYGIYELHKTFLDQPWPDVIICESMLDALSFWVAGKYAVALNGLGNELQFQQLRDLPCRTLILATDSDERGMEARKRIRDSIKDRKLVKEYIFPKGRKDANECTVEELQNLIEVFQESTLQMIKRVL